MLRTKISLADLVERARERVFSTEAINAWHVAQGWPPDEAWYAQHDAEEVARGVCSLCRSGQYRSADFMAFPDPDFVPEEYWGSLELLDECPAWGEFREVVELVERIDCFLTVQENHGPSPQLARDCREDLNLLLVMVDYCLDQGRPLAAAEARHLHSLVCAAAQ
jgi:hypothetical protein